MGIFRWYPLVEQNIGARKALLEGFQTYSILLTTRLHACAPQLRHVQFL